MKRAIALTDRHFKDLSELTLMDDYMFNVVMQDPKIAKAMVENILDTRIRRIEYLEPQKTIKEGYAARGIRVDLFVEDEDGTIYNVEVQTTNRRNLAKRMRYYQSLIDLHILSPGADYSMLRKSYVIFICGYDPFRLGRCIYTFENRCLEQPGMALGDETTKVVLNINGTQDDISDELRDMLQYLRSGVVEGQTSRTLDNAVNTVKNSEERRLDYMVTMAREMELLSEGREEGREEGEDRMGTLMSRLLSLGRIDDALRASTDKVFRKQLYDEFKLQQ